MYVYDFIDYTTIKAKFMKLMTPYRLLLYIIATSNYSQVTGIQLAKLKFKCV